MATALAPLKPRRKDVPKDQVLCDHCTAKCCRYFALPLDTPEDRLGISESALALVPSRRFFERASEVRKGDR